MVNALIGIGLFVGGVLVGNLIGSLWVTSMFVKVNNLYKEETGNDFVTWVFDAQNKLRKIRLEERYAKD